MRKRLTAFFLTLILITVLLPVPAKAAQPASGAAAFRNSDTEAAHDGVCWYVDTMRGGVLTESRLVYSPEGELYDGDFDTRALTEGPVDQLLWWEGRLLVSAGEKLLTLDPDTAEILADEDDAQDDRRNHADGLEDVGPDDRFHPAPERIGKADGHVADHVQPEGKS